MTNTRNLVYAFFFVFLVAPPLNAKTELPEVLSPSPPKLDATSYLLLDYNSGKVLAENNVDTKLAPASLTKILTVYIAFSEIKMGHLKLDDLVTVSQNAVKPEGSKMFLNANEQVKVEDLLKGIIIQSGNDASLALAEHIAGNEQTFAELMNQYATRLGMANSHFANSDGLPTENHFVTARDLGTLTTALLKDFPEYYPWFSEKEFTYNKITQKNRNLLLGRDPSVDGVKTGHTDEAGYCLVASALRDGMRLISVVMGTPSESARASENQSLLNYGFRFFESHRLYQGKTTIQETRIWKGESQQLPLGLADDFYVSIPRRHRDDLKATVSLDKQIQAPVKIGDKLGTVVVKLNDQIVATKDLIALKNVEKGNIFRRLLDALLLKIKESTSE